MNGKEKGKTRKQNRMEGHAILRCQIPIVKTQDVTRNMKPSNPVNLSCSNRNNGKHKLDHHCLEQISKKTDCVLGTI